MQLLKIGTALVCVLFLDVSASGNGAESPCPEGFLPCDDKLQCVARREWCDGSSHCQDRSDEAYCIKRKWFGTKDPNRCKNTHFLCEDGRCVPLVAKCDGHSDCRNGTDEKNCEPEPMDEYDDYDIDPLETTTEPTISEKLFDVTDEEDTAKTTISQPTISYYPSVPAYWTLSSTLPTRSNVAFTGTTRGTYQHTTQRPRIYDSSGFPHHYQLYPTIPYVAFKRADDSERVSTPKEEIAQNVSESSISGSPYLQSTTLGTTHFPGESVCNDGGFRCENPISTTRSPYPTQYGYSSNKNVNCLPRSSFCDGRYDCSNKRDEYYCDDYRTQYRGGCPSDWWKCDDGRCIPSEWKCNGFVDCLDESDEYICSYLKKNQVIITQAPSTIATISAREGRTLGNGMTKRKLLDWFVGRRKNGTVTNKWGHELPRIATALFLSEKEFFEPGNRTMEEMNYELTIQLLSQMAGGGNLKRKDLSLYIHALMVTCVDPRNFHGRDLVSELRSIVDSGNETTSSFDLLVLCNAGDTMTDNDAKKITNAFYSQHRPFWTDNKAMATLALACISSRPGVKVDERTVMDMAQELKKRQFRNGTVDNLKTTALVVQALIATQSVHREFDLEAALRVIQNAQREDGSIGSFLDSYYILPVLANSSLLNVTSEHCKRPTTSEAEALSELQVARGQRLVIQFSVWIGSEVDLKRTWTLKVPVNSSLYNILETVNRLDTRQQVLYNVLDGKPYVSSLMGLQDDVETGLYWFTYVRNTKDDEPTLVEESPVVVKIQPNQELILWYKSGQWSKFATELTTQK